MTIGRTLAFSAALLAAAAAAAALLGLWPQATGALALLAALAAAVSGFRRAPTRADPAAAAAPAAAPVAETASAAAQAAVAELERKRQAEAAARATEREAARATSASALRRLHFAVAVLAKVPVKTEEAAFALMERLIALRDQSAKAANAAQSAESGSNDAEAISALAVGARSTIGSVRSALLEMKKHDREASKGLQALGQELKSGIELLAGIEEITERSKLIAFNMAIEAARMGEKGRGFKVIVGELRALNDRTAGFSKQVSELLGRFKKHNENLVGSAIASSAQVAEEVERGIGEEELAIESLLSASTSCVDLSDSVTQAVRAMNLELDGVLESLQFQDITRQMVEGALATIAEAEGDISPLSHGEDAAREDGASARDEERRRVEELRAQLLARAKTKGEKEAIQEVRK
jgi:hypothetical protein